MESGLIFSERKKNAAVKGFLEHKEKEIPVGMKGIINNLRLELKMSFGANKFIHSSNEIIFSEECFLVGKGLIFISLECFFLFFSEMLGFS